MDSGGIVKVTDVEETALNVKNSFDKAILEHEEKMKLMKERLNAEEEGKISAFSFSLQSPELSVCYFVCVFFMIFTISYYQRTSLFFILFSQR